MSLNSWQLFVVLYHEPMIQFISIMLPLCYGFGFAFPFAFSDLGKSVIVFLEVVAALAWITPVIIFCFSVSESRSRS